MAVGSLDGGSDVIGSNHECNFHFVIEELPSADRYQFFVEGQLIADREFSELEPVDDRADPADKATAVQLTLRDAPVGELSEEEISEFDDARREQKSAEYAEDFNRALFGKKGWLVHPPIQTGSDSSGYFKGRTRIENEEDRTRSATFTFTLLRDEQIVATLRGTALDVEPGEIVTLELISQDPFDPGENKWDFQVDVQT